MSELGDRLVGYTTVFLLGFLTAQLILGAC